MVEEAEGKHVERSRYGSLSAIQVACRLDSKHLLGPYDIGREEVLFGQRAMLEVNATAAGHQVWLDTCLPPINDHVANLCPLTPLTNIPFFGGLECVQCRQHQVFAAPCTEPCRRRSISRCST